MTYPPNNPGYPAQQQPAGYGAPSAAPLIVREPGASKSPGYLTVAVVLLGFAAYLASFGPLLSINTNMGPFGGAEFTASGLSYWTMAALVAALLAAVSLVVKGSKYTPVVAVAAVLGLLLVIGQLVNRPTGVAVGWALWLVLLFTLLQAGAAVTALLFEHGVITPPAPRAQYAHYGQYGPPPAVYYGQPGAPGSQGTGYPTQVPTQAPAPTQYQGAGYTYTPATYGQPDNSPETPPTGFPSLGQQSGSQPSSSPESGSTSS